MGLRSISLSLFTHLFVLNILCHADDASAVLDGIRSARKKWESAHIEVSVSYKRPSHDVAFEKRYEQVFDHLNLRSETIETGEGGEPFEHLKLVTDTQYILYTTHGAETPHPVVSHVTDLDISSKGPLELIPDPRFIGLAACSFGSLVYYQTRTCVTKEIRAGIEPVLTDGEWEGYPCKVLTYTLGDDGDYMRATVVPDLDFAVVRVEEVSEKIEHYAVIDTKYAEVDGMQLPMSYQYRLTQKGEVFEEEQGRISVSSANEVVPEETFTLEGLSPRKGTLFIVDSTQPGWRSGHFEWDGEKLVDIRFPREEKPFVSGFSGRGPVSAFTVLLVVNGFAFAVVGFLLYVKSRTHPSANENDEN